MAGVNKYIATQKAFRQENGRIDRIIGDKKRPDEFRDCIEFKWNIKWPNEFKFSALLLTEQMFDTKETEKSIEEKDGKITTKTNLIKNEYYDLPDDTGTEHEFTLYECPKKGIIPVSLLRKGLTFLHQPALTDEYKAGWSDKFNCETDVTETDVTDTQTGQVLVHRPKQYVNSYAVYNDYYAGHIINQQSGLDANYYSGKLGHLHRYCAYLPDGKKIWLKTVLDKDILNIVLPESILADETLWKAGLRVGPTFGNSAAGASYTSLLMTKIIGGKFTNNFAGNVTGMSAYGGKYGTVTIKCTLYSDVSGTCTSRLLDNSNQTSISAAYDSPVWNANTMSSNIAVNGSASPYWLIIFNNRPTSGSDYYYYYYDSSGGYCTGDKYVGNTNLPATFPSYAENSKKVSVFATVEAAAPFKPKIYFINC